MHTSSFSTLLKIYFLMIYLVTTTYRKFLLLQFQGVMLWILNLDYQYWRVTFFISVWMFWLQSILLCTHIPVAHYCWRRQAFVALPNLGFARIHIYNSVRWLEIQLNACVLMTANELQVLQFTLLHVVQATLWLEVIPNLVPDVVFSYVLGGATVVLLTNLSLQT